MKRKFNSTSKEMIGDLVMPMALYMRVREQFSQAFLLESSDHMSKENSMSFICFEPLITLSIDDGELKIDNDPIPFNNVVDVIQTLLDEIEINGSDTCKELNGLFGYTSYEAVQHFETIEFDSSKKEKLVPEIRYDFFRYIIVFDHYHSMVTLIENCPEGELSNMRAIESLIHDRSIPQSSFMLKGEESSDITDGDYKEMVTKAKQHCQRGDVFQLVLARRFKQAFEGDDFNLYRALRSINPSPYLFYYDYGDYRIFGSSPEAQLKVDHGIAEIHPIAGTFRRTGNIEEDAVLADKLLADPKETSEHVMLVDLARNDLSKNTEKVTVKVFKQIQYFSHVIHIVSVVIGKLLKGKSGFQVYADTFPAGTLSGAPKYKAMELIDKYESHSRSIYGGGIGMLKLNGDLNHAIIIRSFLSKDNTLYRQAGAGLVIGSDEEKELMEVNHKLAALKKALTMAENI